MPDCPRLGKRVKSATCADGCVTAASAANRQAKIRGRRIRPRCNPSFPIPLLRKARSRADSPTSRPNPIRMMCRASTTAIEIARCAAGSSISRRTRIRPPVGASVALGRHCARSKVFTLGHASGAVWACTTRWGPLRTNAAQLRAEANCRQSGTFRPDHTKYSGCAKVFHNFLWCWLLSFPAKTA